MPSGRAWLDGIGLLAAALSAATPLQAAGRAGAAVPCVPDGSQPVVIRAVGEDFSLALADGRLVRIAGIDPVRATADRPDLAAEARLQLADRLVGKPAAITVLGTADRWNRVPALAFAALGSPPSANEAPMLRPVAVDLVAAGMARARPEPESHGCWPALLGAEAAARGAGLGLWADPYYAVRNADDLPAFHEAAMDGMVLVEGRVAHVGQSGARLYIDLGPIHGSVALRLIRRAAFIVDQLGMRQGDLVGLMLRARGVVDDRGGPQIDVIDADQIEVLGRPAGTP